MTISTIRRSTSQKLRGLELPACFQSATVSAAINAQDRNTVAARAARKRAVRKAYRVSGVAR